MAGELPSGDTTVHLQIGVDGHVTECTIIRSSGSPALDAATCEQMFEYAHFNPATDEQGQPRVGSYTLTINWRQFALSN